MKLITLTICAATLLLISCNNADDKAKTETSSAENKEKMADVKNETPPPPMDEAAMTKAWMDFAAPGAMHKWMEKTNGTWVCDSVSQWMAADAPPTKSKATNQQISAIGGRYVTGKFTGTMMGQPFEGMSTMGYDNAKKMFTSTWIDNMGTGIVHMTGTYDEATKTLHLKGHQTDAMTGKDSDMREEMKMIDDNTYSLIMYGTGMDGKEAKFMEGTFKRKK